MISRHIIILWLVAILPGLAADPFSEGVRTTPWLSPEDEQKKFHLPPGFEIQLVASEPDLIKPMNMAFDARGRLWVTVTREYPYAAPLDKPARDAIKILEDTNGDGKADKITTFADGLNIPTGIYPFDGGCIAWGIPNIWLFRDTNKDDKADTREVLFGPLGWERDTHGMNSSFRRGFDGWVYATHGFNNNSTVRGKDGSEIKMNSGNTYRFRVDGSRVEQHTFGQVNPFGLCLDPMGNIYSADCHSSPIYQLLRGGYYPSFGKPHDGLGFAPVMMEHAHGSTAICGVLYYSDSLWPEEYRDNMFVCNVMTSRINRDRLSEHGSTKIAHELPDFLTTDDPWFRPVDLQLGPDGALYVADFYNRIIGHYEVPLEHPGRDRTSGRIWRITYSGKTHSKRPDLARASAGKLIQALGDPNMTYRMLATDQLTDRIGHSAVTPLKRALKTATGTQKVHILWALSRFGALEEKMIQDAAKDPSREVRVHAMRILTEKPKRAVALQALSDSDAFVQRSAAEALAVDPHPENVPPLLRLLDSASAQDTHLVYAVRRGLRDQFLKPGILANLDLSPEQARRVADIAIAVKSEEAGAFLIKHLSNNPQIHSSISAQLRHAARYAPETQLDTLASIARSKVGNDVDLQHELFKSIQEGAAQRGKPLTPGCQQWGQQLAEQLLASAEASNLEWVNTPMPGATDAKNPWFVQKRASADGNNGSRFLCSLPPGGEHLTGTLRSKPFSVPAQLKFYLAGHDGYPDKPAQKKNLVRLVDTASGDVLKQVYPPRNDMAQAITWDLKEHSDKPAILEVVDNDTGNAYAWLAIGRFDPPVLKIPAGDPSQIAKRQKAAAELAGTLKVASLEPRLTTLMLAPQTESDAKAALAQAIVTIKPNDFAAALSAILPDPGVPASLRDAITSAIAGKAKAEDVASEVLRAVSHRLQVKLAQALAGSTTSAEYLLNSAPPGLLLDRNVKEKLLAAKVPDAAARIEKLTHGISAPNEALQKLVERRQRKFDAGKARMTEGAALFQQHCAVCHQVDGNGGVVGPQLEGIGNRGLERLCEDIIDPNRNVDPAFRSTLLVLKDGDVQSGLFRREEGATVILAESTGKEISVPKNQITERRQSETSLMPENFGELLTDEQFNHLLAFLLSKRAKTP
jgi:putative heme-binding domain-containing protein